MSEESSGTLDVRPIEPSFRDGVAGSELLADLPAEVLIAVQGQCAWRRYDPGDAVLSAGADRNHGVYFVIEGTVELFRDAAPSAVPLTRVSAGEYFGEFAAVYGATGSVSARAAEPALVAEIPRETFVSLLADHPHLPLRLLKRQVALIRSLNERLSMLETRDRHVARVYSLLLRATL